MVAEHTGVPWLCGSSAAPSLCLPGLLPGSVLCLEVLCVSGSEGSCFLSLKLSRALVWCGGSLYFCSLPKHSQPGGLILSLFCYVAKLPNASRDTQHVTLFALKLSFPHPSPLSFPGPSRALALHSGPEHGTSGETAATSHRGLCEPVEVVDGKNGSLAECAGGRQWSLEGAGPHLSLGSLLRPLAGAPPSSQPEPSSPSFREHGHLCLFPVCGPVIFPWEVFEVSSVENKGFWPSCSVLKDNFVHYELNVYHYSSSKATF